MVSNHCFEPPAESVRTIGQPPIESGRFDQCVFRTNVTARFGIVTADFGSVTGRFGDVTDAASAPARVRMSTCQEGRCWCCV